MLAAGSALPLLPVQPALPCPLRSLTGLPCPFCGMTRSVTAAIHLRLDEALVLNPAGVLAVVVAIGLLVAWRVRSVEVPVRAAPIALLLLWVWQLARYPNT